MSKAILRRSITRASAPDSGNGKKLADSYRQILNKELGIDLDENAEKDANLSESKLEEDANSDADWDMLVKLADEIVDDDDYSDLALTEDAHSNEYDVAAVSGDELPKAPTLNIADLDSKINSTRAAINDLKKSINTKDVAKESLTEAESGSKESSDILFQDGLMDRFEELAKMNRELDAINAQRD